MTKVDEMFRPDGVHNKGAVARQRFVLAAIFINGFLLSFVIYLVMSAQIKNFIDKEYDIAAQRASRLVFSNMNMLGSRFETLSLSTFLMEGQPVPYADDFSNMTALVKESRGWRIKPVVQLSENAYKSLSQSGAALLQQYEVDAASRKLSGKEGNDLYVYTILPDDRATPDLYFLRPVDLGSQNRQAFVFGKPNLDRLFPQDWLNSSRYLMSFALHARGSEIPVWSQTSQTSGTGSAFGYGQNFDMEFGGESWQLRISFRQNSALMMIGALPFVFFMLGMAFTFLLVYSVRGTHRSTQKLLLSRYEMEAKNRELEVEVAERERLNLMLAQSEREYRAVIDAVSDIIFETDTTGEIVFLSASWRKVTGFDPDQFIGHDLFSMLHPQDQKHQRADFSLLIKGQKQGYRAFTRLRTSDGTFRAVEIAVSMMRQDKSRNLRVVGTLTDVEERRRAERALSEAEKKYRAIVENAAGGIYQLTPEGIYLSANPAMARILGYSSPEQILREVKNATTSVYLNSKERLQFLRDINAKGEYKSCEAQMVKRDGTSIWVSENVRAVRDDGGGVLYFEGSIEDITERKKSEIALREAKLNSDLANRAKSEFLANMSHELRTPLNSIIGFSEMIKNEVLGKIEQRSYWEYSKDIYESGRALLKVINEILDISKIEAGNRQLNESEVDLEKSVFACLDLMSAKIESNRMHIVNTLLGTPKVWGEELAIKQILMNLLSNAVKFTPSQGRITVSAEVDHHGELRLSITDTGIGLDEAEIEKALSPFGQINNDLSRSESGTGLGLTLVDSLIRLHDGKLEVLSQKGLGTTVTVVFPVERVIVQGSGNNGNGRLRVSADEKHGKTP